MSPLVTGAIALATEPSPNPTEDRLRPGLEEWQVSPGLIGFVVTFVLAVACVLLFLNLSKHLRRANHNAREQGLPVPAPQVVSFRRSDADGGTADGKGSGSSGNSGATDGAGGSDAGGPSSGTGGGSPGGDSGGSGD